jgi:GGDEF domain-containing protein
MAHIDSRTGILNHQYFFSEIDRILGSGKTGNMVFAELDRILGSGKG